VFSPNMSVGPQHTCKPSHDSPLARALILTV
jgi:hypothetical protein